MTVSGRAIGGFVALALIVEGSAGCTSMKTVGLEAHGNAAPFGVVKAGDRVILELRDGRTETFDVGRIETENLISTTGDVYARNDIVKLQRRSISPARTTLLITGLAVAAFVVLAALALGSGGIPVY